MGRTWEDKTPNSTPLLKDLVLRGGRGWLVGAEGAIYHSTDNGESWIKLKAPTQTDLQEKFFLDSVDVCRTPHYELMITNSLWSRNHFSLRNHSEVGKCVCGL